MLRNFIFFKYYFFQIYFLLKFLKILEKIEIFQNFFKNLSKLDFYF
jgi:hypothetical protein